MERVGTILTTSLTASQDGIGKARSALLGAVELVSVLRSLSDLGASPGHAGGAGDGSRTHIISLEGIGETQQGSGVETKSHSAVDSLMRSLTAAYD